MAYQEHSSEPSLTGNTAINFHWNLCSLSGDIKTVTPWHGNEREGNSPEEEFYQLGRRALFPGSATVLTSWLKPVHTALVTSYSSVPWASPNDRLQTEGAGEATYALWQEPGLSCLWKPPRLCCSRHMSSSPRVHVAVLPFHLTCLQICCVPFSGVTACWVHSAVTSLAAGRRKRSLPMAQEPVMH